MNDLRNVYGDYVAQTSAANLSNTATPPRSPGVREVVQNNTKAMQEISLIVDALLEALRGPKNCESCDGARGANPEGLLSDVTRQAQILDDINRDLVTVISLLNG